MSGAKLAPLTVLEEIEHDELPVLGQAILYVIGQKYPGLSHATIRFDHLWRSYEPDSISADIELRVWPDGVRAVIHAEWIWARRADQADDDEGEYQVVRVDFEWRSLTRLAKPVYWFDRGPERKRSYTFYVFGEVPCDFEICPIKAKKVPA